MGLLTLNEAAAQSRICVRTLSRHIESGSGPVVTRLGRRVLIDEADIKCWLESRRQVVPGQVAS